MRFLQSKEQQESRLLQECIRLYRKFGLDVQTPSPSLRQQLDQLSAVELAGLLELSRLLDRWRAVALSAPSAESGK
jgi:hypothetical protein